MPNAAAAATPAARARRTSAARTTLTPEAWIDAATQVLVDRGIDHVRVDVLAQALGVTRGSFYWHFCDRDDLLRRVLQAWHERATGRPAVRRSAARAADSKAQAREPISRPSRAPAALRAAHIELAIRAWARRDDTARAAVDDTDARRIADHERRFAGLGFHGDEARARAFILYGHEVAESLLHRQGTAADRVRRTACLERLLLRPS